MLLIIVGIAAMLSRSPAHAETKYAAQCRTAANVTGFCVPLDSCGNVRELVERIHQSDTFLAADNPIVKFLRQSSCGLLNGVCSPGADGCGCPERTASAPLLKKRSATACGAALSFVSWSQQPSHQQISPQLSTAHVCCPEDQVHLNRLGVQILRNTTCGSFSLPKISGGREADLYTFPWMALLKYKNNRFRCGGSLISDRYILTAAHCVNKVDDPVLEVRLGEHRISTEEDCIPAGPTVNCAPPVEDIGIERIIIHDQRRENDWLHNDIALLRLNRTVEFNSSKRHIKTICLPITMELTKKVHDDYIISGWGRTETGESSDVLLWTRVPHRNLEECENTLGIKGLTDKEICAGGEGLKDSCVGDSGGPLAQTDLYEKQSRLVQFGVVSSGIKWCGQVNAPAIYTSVSHYMQWITDNLVA